jgi:hypothetical protein
MNFTPNLVIGIGITFVGIALTLERFGVVEAWSLMRLWPVLLVLFGVSVVVQAFRPARDPMPGVRQRPIISPPFVFAIVIIGLLGAQASSRRTVAAPGNSQDTVSLFAVMGGDNRTSFAKPFRRGEMTSFMGGSRLDLRQATIAPGEDAVIDVFAMMGGVIINVPPDWIVDVEAVSVMGGVKDERFGPRRRDRGRILAEAEAPGGDQGERERRLEAESVEPRDTTPASPQATPAPETTGPQPRLVVRGFVMMGGLIIRS